MPSIGRGAMSARSGSTVHHHRSAGGAPALRGGRLLDELRQIFDWTRSHVHHCLTICWAAQAAVYHFHGIPKHVLPRKAFGVFDHRVLAPASPFLRGFSDECVVPVSRWTEIRREESRRTRPRRAARKRGDRNLPAPRPRPEGAARVQPFRIRGRHPRRRVRQGCRWRAARELLPRWRPGAAPRQRWRSHAHLLFGNWIDTIYQTAPFDLAEIGAGLTPSRRPS